MADRTFPILFILVLIQIKCIILVVIFSFLARYVVRVFTLIMVSSADIAISLTISTNLTTVYFRYFALRQLVFYLMVLGFMVLQINDL